MRETSRAQDKKLADKNTLGKTTTATKFPKHLLLAFEKGYSAIAGAMAQPINSWGEFRKVLRMLKDEKVKEKYETIIIDTADIAYDYVERYICSNNGVDSIGDVGFGKGYTMAGKEFDSALRSIVQMGYGLVLISHSADKTFTDEAGKEFNQIVPTLGNKPRNIVNRMADIIGYSRGVETEEGSSTVLFMRGTSRYVAGSRFKYTPDYIQFSYSNLVDAIGKAIDKQMEEDGKEFFTDSAVNTYLDTTADLDYDKLVAEFNAMVASIPGSSASSTPEEVSAFKEDWVPRIEQIVSSYLGKGGSVSKSSRDQVEAIDLVVSEMRELLKYKNI